MIRKLDPKFLNQPSEKRHHPRVPVTHGIQIIGANGRLRETIRHVRSISDHGLSFRIPKPVSKDTPLKIMIILQGTGKRIAVTAKVVSVHPSARKNGYVLAVSVIHILERDRTLWHHLVEQYQA